MLHCTRFSNRKSCNTALLAACFVLETCFRLENVLKTHASMKCEGD